MVPFGEYLPDLPGFQNPGATIAKNVIPLTDRSYGPFTALSALTGAIGARCQGGIAGRDPSGNVFVFSGDATKLYHLKTDNTWENVSVGGGYIIAPESAWNFVQYGARLIACGWGNPLQSFVLGTDAAFSALAATAPQSRYIAAIRDFVMVGNTYDVVYGNQPNQVWWCAIDAPTDWPTLGTTTAAQKQSDAQILPDGGWVQGIIGAVGGADGAAFLEESVYRISYEGPPTVFRFDRVERQRGTMVPSSIVNVGDFAFYLGHDGFYAFDGSRSMPVGANKVDKTFFNDYDPTYYYRVVGVADVFNKIVMWAYPGVGNNAGTPNKILVFNWQLNRWSIVEQELEYFFRSYSKSYTLEDLDTFGTLDTLPYSLDSRVWTGGALLLNGFDTSHKLGNFMGSNLAATLETGELDGGNGRRLFISGIRPLVDGGTVTAAIGSRVSPSGSVVYGTPTPAGVDGICPQRISARYARAQVNIVAGGAWTHALGVDATMQPAGER